MYLHHPPEIGGKIATSSPSFTIVSNPLTYFLLMATANRNVSTVNSGYFAVICAINLSKVFPPLVSSRSTNNCDPQTSLADAKTQLWPESLLYNSPRIGRIRFKINTLRVLTFLTKF